MQLRSPIRARGFSLKEEKIFHDSFGSLLFSRTVGDTQYACHIPQPTTQPIHVVVHYFTVAETFPKSLLMLTLGLNTMLKIMFRLRLAFL